MISENKTPNKLINEKSPYLLQHAYNPVDWYPWGDEAFEKAKAEDKPVFLSIGYSTCHWCHVMERESFEDKKAAALLNSLFVCIKVDREERPDIDHVYMEVCQAMTGSGGWPLTLFLDEKKRPFFSGTYFTRNQLMELLHKIDELWRTKRNVLAEASEKILQYLHTDKTAQLKTDEKDLPGKAYESLKGGFDAQYGGFFHAPKFPTPQQILFLMRYAKRTGRQDAMEMALKTLEGIDRGGIHDHIGFGFCRYSTDRRWLVPHFEKMLYDNALLAITYAAAFAYTKKTRLAQTAKSTLAYLLRVMRGAEGGFYTAEDADSEGAEGKFYVWSQNEVMEVLGETGGIFCDAFDITPEGNFEGKNIPNLIDIPLPLEKIPSYEKQRLLLFSAREKRVHPFLDDKILTCWNGLAMAALAFTGRITDEPTYVEAGKEIWRFIKDNLFDRSGRLLSSYREKTAKTPAHADDYAYLIWGLIELYASCWDLEVLAAAVELNRRFLEDFWDEQRSGFFFTGKTAEALISRTKPVYDGAVPSANSVAVMNLLRLSGLTGEEELEQMAQKMIKDFAGEAGSMPAAYSHMMNAELRATADTVKIVLTGAKTDELKALLQDIKEVQTDEIDIVLLGTEQEVPLILKEYYAFYQTTDEEPAAYVCTGKTCLPPARGRKEIAALFAAL